LFLLRVAESATYIIILMAAVPKLRFVLADDIAVRDVSAPTDFDLPGADFVLYIASPDAAHALPHSFGPNSVNNLKRA
jgi:hypothetical protein